MNRDGGQIQVLCADDPCEDAEGAPVSGVISAAGRLDRALAETLAANPQLPQLSRARLQALIDEGRVSLDGKVVKTASFKVAEGAGFAIDMPQVAPLAAEAQEIPLTIVYEDAHLIVVDKPAGLVVHPAAGNMDGTLVNALLHHCKGSLSGIGGVARPGIVHRIDKDTSGLLVVAKSNAAHEGLARQFAEHSIERAYMAVVAGWPNPPAATLTGVIARSPTDRKKMALVPVHEPRARYQEMPNTGGPAKRAVPLRNRPKPETEETAEPETPQQRGKHVITHYATLEQFDDARDGAALVECRLETGRTHQVRVHMASIGHGLLGDQAYGRSQKSLKALTQELGFARQALHAAVLGFIHPVTGEALRFTSEMPADMRELLEALADEAPESS